jgi:hypothetical protein
MSRILTTYKQPSIADRIRTAADVKDLSQLRDEITFAMLKAGLDPSGRTIRDWREAVYTRICQLIAAAITPGDACFIFNTVYLWYPHDDIRAHLRGQLDQRLAQLPDDATRLRAEGIEIAVA